MGAYGEISQDFKLTGIGEPERVQASIASSDLFSTLGIRALVGCTFLPEEDKSGAAAVVLLSHRYWQRRFGADPAIVGPDIALDGRKFSINRRFAGDVPDHEDDGSLVAHSRLSRLARRSHSSWNHPGSEAQSRRDPGTGGSRDRNAEPAGNGGLPRFAQELGNACARHGG